MTTAKTNIEQIMERFSVSAEAIVIKKCDSTHCVFFKIEDKGELYTVAYFDGRRLMFV